MKHRPQGFTLVELLVVMALMGIFLGMMAAALNQSSRYTRNVTSRSEMNDELRTAGQMMADQITRALYIYPPGSQIKLNASDTWSVQDSGGDTTWVVGDEADPIIAFIQAPDVRDTAANSCSNSNGTIIVNPTYCMTFVAYYPLVRSMVTDPSRVITYGPSDAKNSTARMIFEYRKVLLFNRLGYPIEDATDIVKPGSGVTTPNIIIDSAKSNLVGGQANLVVDYIDSTATTATGFIFKASGCRDSNGVYMDSSGNPLTGDKTAKYVDSANNDIKTLNNIGDSSIEPSQASSVACRSTVAPADTTSLVASVTQGVLELTGKYTDRGGAVAVVPTLSFPITPRNLASNSAYNINQ